MRSTRSRARDATNLLTATPYAAALAIACALGTARDLLRLELTSRRFSAKCIAGGGGASSGGGGGAAAPAEMLSLVDEAARRWVAGCSEQERGWVPRRERESWLGLMHEVEVLRLPLAFARVHPSFALSENGAVATMTGVGSAAFRWLDAKAGDQVGGLTAARTVVMRAGRHYAEFTVKSGDTMRFGVIQPWENVEGGETEADEDANPMDDEAGHCYYYRYIGRTQDSCTRFPLPKHGDCIGMLLDLDQHSVTIWKNEIRLGEQMDTGIQSGPCCWAVSTSHEGYSVRIDSAVAPAPPTEEQLAAAAEWWD